MFSKFISSLSLPFIFYIYSGDIRAAVRLPEGEDENEWIATHSK